MLKRPNPQISESFDRVIAVTSAYHFVNPNVVFKGTLRSLRPGGIFVLVSTLKSGHPMFRSVQKLVSHSFERERESQFSFQRATNLNAKVSQQEFCFPLGVAKSKLYEMFRCRYMSIFDHFSDDQIEEGIRKFENDVLRDLKDDDLINDERAMLVTRAEKVA